jgi:hypothetical protein
MSYFSASYAEARSRFREAARRLGGRLDVLELGGSGPEGERLTIDICWFGSERPRQAFVHSSGLHGVEGFAGSAIQLHCLDCVRLDPRSDAAIAIVHVLNPYGMAWLRRANENNVDLNRNFLARGESYQGASEAYMRLASFLNPRSAPRPDAYYARAAFLILRYGLPALRQAVAAGQYALPAGLFFGGSSPEEGPRKYRAYLAERLGDAEHLVALDVHTGLGQFGDDQLLVDDHAIGESGATACFGERVRPLDAKRSVAYATRGHLGLLYPEVAPRARVRFAFQEFGTMHPIRVLRALREENRWHHYGGGSVSHPSKRALLEVFVPSSREWRERVLGRGREAFAQALGFAAEPPAAAAMASGR